MKERVLLGGEGGQKVHLLVPGQVGGKGHAAGARDMLLDQIVVARSGERVGA